jgi:hypothetical protein
MEFSHSKKTQTAKTEVSLLSYKLAMPHHKSYILFS